MVRRFAFVSLFAVFAALGCHAQVPPPTSHVVKLTWTAPTNSASWAGCTATNPCTYAVYRCTVGATCADQTTVAWTEVTPPLARPSGLTFTDTGASGLTVQYVVETVQGGANSAPSNSSQVSVPGIPLAPAVNSPTVASNAPPISPAVRPALDPTPQLASLHAPGSVRLIARVAR